MPKTQAPVVGSIAVTRTRGSLMGAGMVLAGFFLAVLWGALGSSASAEANIETAPDSPRVAAAFGSADDDTATVTTSATRAPAAFGSDSAPATSTIDDAAPAPRAPAAFGSTDVVSPTVRQAQSFGDDTTPAPRPGRVASPEVNLGEAPLADAAPAAPTFVAAPIAVNQCNGTDNVGGQAVECTITVTNNINLATGVTSSTMTVRECHGVANAAPTCTVTPLNSSDVVTSVDQCNGSGNGGGGTVTCQVDITNNITGAATTSPVTVNQCNTAGTGGGTEPTIACNPFPANTTGATVTQCNSAGTGGGATMRVRCTVDGASTETATFPMSIEQCVGSGNGGGGFVTCSVSLRTNVTAAQVEPTPADPDEPTPADPDEPTPDEPTPTEPEPTPTDPDEPTPADPDPTPDPSTPSDPGSPTPTPAPGTPGPTAPSPGAPVASPVAGTPAPGAAAPTGTPGTAADAPPAAPERSSSSRSTTGRGMVTGGGSATATSTGSGSATGQEFAVTGIASATLVALALFTLLLGGLLVLFSKSGSLRVRRV